MIYRSQYVGRADERDSAGVAAPVAFRKKFVLRTGQGAADVISDDTSVSE